MSLTNLQQTLQDSRSLDKHWIEGGWEMLAEKEVLDIYPLVEVDISVNITIKLATKTYIVPLEDVSPLDINDCLVIGVEDLYPDWEDRIWKKMSEGSYINKGKEEANYYVRTFVDSSGKVRIIKNLKY